MPVKEFTPAGITEGKYTQVNTNNIDNTRGAAAGGAATDGTYFAMAKKQGGKWRFSRGQFIFDFSTGLPSGIKDVKIYRADLILSDTIMAASATGGDKMVVSHIFNPNTFGTWHSNDYSNARFSSHTSGQAVTNGTDNFVFRLDNPTLVREIQNALNGRTRIHLATRNYLDSSGASGGAVTGTNSIQFDDVDDNDPLKLRIYYRAISARRYFRGAGARMSKSGFAGTSFSCGSTSGFGDF